MNQILYVKNNKSLIKNKYYKIIFLISIICFFIIQIMITSYFIFLSSKEKESKKILNNYEISKLYANKQDKTNTLNNNIFGIIEISEINIYYPVFSNISDDLLKIAPCKFYGDSLSVNGNICIAGHNYDNNLFFSNLFLLDKNSEISIYDNLGNKYLYIVTDKYETLPNDMSPIYDYNNKEKILTLITCNNINSKRLVLRAKQKSF